MKSFFPIGLSCFFLLAACNKDKFQTKPTIIVKSVSSEVVPQQQSLDVALEITDKQGDVRDSVFVILERKNGNAPDPRSRTLVFDIPTFPNSSKIDMNITLDYGRALTLNSLAIDVPGTGGQKAPDTLDLKFSVRDAAKNMSDTVTKRIIVIR
ncbi:hypothetical protein V9K67_14045 [Paraflavisolibacter sp. H34]|uniref:hypothetical protein n=1 Tax=Huijunlia imazamoxiresistens TaxID=3127457 RepID=UPI003017897F